MRRHTGHRFFDTPHHHGGSAGDKAVHGRGGGRADVAYAQHLSGQLADVIDGAAPHPQDQIAFGGEVLQNLRQSAVGGLDVLLLEDEGAVGDPSRLQEHRHPPSRRGIGVGVREEKDPAAPCAPDNPGDLLQRPGFDHQLPHLRAVDLPAGAGKAFRVQKPMDILACQFHNAHVFLPFLSGTSNHEKKPPVPLGDSGL